MKFLYKYPHAAYPYGDLLQTNGRRSREEMEYELLDTRIFNDDRYFDVFVEYAKGGADLGSRRTARTFQRVPRACPLRILTACRQDGPPRGAATRQNPQVDVTSYLECLRGTAVTLRAAKAADKVGCELPHPDRATVMTPVIKAGQHRLLRCNGTNTCALTW